MQNGTRIQPGDTDATFQNVPVWMEGLTYFGHPINVSAGMWNIEFEPPLKMYIWVMEGASDSLELVAPTQGWQEENCPGFQSSDGYKLFVLSKYIENEDMYTGRWECFRTISSSFCGGLVGVYPLPKEPEVIPASSVPQSAFPVTNCSGLEVEWNPPLPMEEGTQTNPGEQASICCCLTCEIEMVSLLLVIFCQ